MRSGQVNPVEAFLAVCEIAGPGNRREFAAALLVAGLLVIVGVVFALS